MANQVPPSAQDANTSTQTDKAALTAAANAAFIDGAAQAINVATTLGKYQVYVNSISGMDRLTIQQYFQGLGYDIAIPNYNNGEYNPAQLFGEIWEEYWVDQYLPYSFLPYYNHYQPYQVMIRWKQPV